jgi:hypothetical protein
MCRNVTSEISRHLDCLYTLKYIRPIEAEYQTRCISIAILQLAWQAGGTSSTRCRTLGLVTSWHFNFSTGWSQNIEPRTYITHSRLVFAIYSSGQGIIYRGRLYTVRNVGRAEGRIQREATGAVAAGPPPNRNRTHRPYWDIWPYKITNG